jgi:hypothetical protein
MSRPTASPAAERAYALLEPIVGDDDQRQWIALRLVSALAQGEQPVWELAEDPGLLEALDPRTCDPKWLPFVAQIVGGRLRGGMTVDQQRAECIRPTGWTAGIAVELAGVALVHMVEGGRVSIRWRYNPATSADDAPGHLSVRIRASDVLPGHEEAVVRDVGDAIPAHLLADVEVSDYATYDDRRDAHADYDALRDAHADYDDLRDA